LVTVDGAFRGVFPGGFSGCGCCVSFFGFVVVVVVVVVVVLICLPGF